VAVHAIDHALLVPWHVARPGRHGGRVSPRRTGDHGFGLVEHSSARDVEHLLAEGADREALARAGVGWLVTESGDDVTLTRIGGDHPAPPYRGVLIAAHIAWLAALLGGLAGMLAGWVRRRRITQKVMPLILG